MTRQEVVERVQAVFQDVFDDPKMLIRDDLAAKDVEDWDSLTHVNLVTAIEKEFSVRFALAEIQALKNVGDLVELVLRKKAG
jgi:acyl carrier protein